jgi:hypothetical protein
MLLVTELFQLARRLLDGCNIQNAQRIKAGVLLLLQCKIISKPLQSSAQGRKNGLLYGVLQFNGEMIMDKESENILVAFGKGNNRDHTAINLEAVTTMF